MYQCRTQDQILGGAVEERTSERIPGGPLPDNFVIVVVARQILKLFLTQNFTLERPGFFL